MSIHMSQPAQPDPTAATSPGTPPLKALTALKLTRKQALLASYGELLAQTKWAKDPNGLLLRTKQMSVGQALEVLSWLDDHQDTLALSNLPEGSEHLGHVSTWLHTSPLWTRLLTTVLTQVSGLPRVAMELLLSVEPEVMLSTGASFFVGTQHDLSELGEITDRVLAHTCEHEHG